MTIKSILLAVIIAAGVVTVPLLLKSTREPDPQLVQPHGAVQAAPGLPRFVDVGTTTCAPCKVMLGVMAELENKYPGAFTIEFVNVKENPAQAERYDIRIIPSQIFYSPDGRELYRHTGVFRTEDVIAKWAELGFHFKPAAQG